MVVDIFMATYNGEKYLRNQLLSLQQQTFQDWTLWVRDDGSTDATNQIIDEFVRSDIRIKRVTDGSGKRLGAGANFLGLAKYGRGEYAIFCDQDDIWFEKKLELLLKLSREKFDPRVPSLVYCDALGYSDTEGVVSSDKVWLWHARSLKEFLFFNSGYQGCSMLFNKALRNLAVSYRGDYVYMHDDVVSLLAHVFGEVFFLPKALMLYRQHDCNVTGNIVTGFFDRLRLFFRRDAAVISSRHYRERKAFFEAYKNEMSSDSRFLFSQYIEYPRRSLLLRLLTVFRCDFSIGGARLSLYLKTLLRAPIG